MSEENSAATTTTVTQAAPGAQAATVADAGATTANEPMTRESRAAARASRFAKIVADADKRVEGVGDETTEDASAGETAAAEAAPDAKTEAKPDPEKPKAPPISEDKMAARFSALSKREAETRRSEEDLQTAQRTFAGKQQQLDSAHAARMTELDKRESKIREREESDHQLLADTPERVFQHLERLGVTSMKDFRAIAEKTWGQSREQKKREAEANKVVDPKDKPLTQAEVERLMKADREKAAYDAEVRAAIDGFVKVTESADEKGEDAYPAASTIWSRKQRVAKGDAIGARLKEQGKSFTHADLADAVNTLAEQHPRWQKILKRTARVGSAGTKQEAGSPAKAVLTDARNGQQGQPKSESAPARPEVSKAMPPPAAYANGATTLTRKEARKLRMSKWASSE